MLCNVYDFDKTIYDGDSTVDFYLFCLKTNLRIIRNFPRQLWAFLNYKFGYITKRQFKEEFFSFLLQFNNINLLISRFWSTNQKKIMDWYINQSNVHDVIISASPEFLLLPLKEILVNHPMIIASKVDSKTGRFSGENCYGEEKVKRFYQWDPAAKIACFYTDSFSDIPLAKLAQNAYLMKKGQIVSKINIE